MKIRDELIKLNDELVKLKDTSNSGKVVTITEHDVAEVISKWTNIPLTKLTEGEAERLLSLADSQ